VCPVCRLNNRWRAAIHILDVHCGIDRQSPVYITEHATKLCKLLQSKLYSHLLGSEFLGDEFKPGEIVDGICHEDLTRLSFPENALAGVLSFDVLEHIPRYRVALSEIYRCLAPRGEFVFSVPVDVRAEHTLIRAEKLPDGTIRHLQPPQYHGDPVNPKKGILCYQTFGWDLPVLLREVGFTEINVIDYWSMDYGYLGGCYLFSAHKAASPVTTSATVPVSAEQTSNFANVEAQCHQRTGCNRGVGTCSPRGKTEEAILSANLPIRKADPAPRFAACRLT
jgi:SAM-dependent methyltransferase